MFLAASNAHAWNYIALVHFRMYPKITPLTSTPTGIIVTISYTNPSIPKITVTNKNEEGISLSGHMYIYKISK